MTAWKEIDKVGKQSWDAVISDETLQRCHVVAERVQIKGGLILKLFKDIVVVALLFLWITHYS